ncbi:hypothetical protein ACHAXN_007950 [Cyclotella atomus]
MSDVPTASHPSFIHRMGVIHAADDSGNSNNNVNLFVNDVGLYPIAVNWLQSKFCYKRFAFTPYSSPTAWTANFSSEAPLDHIIISQTFLEQVMNTQHPSRDQQRQPPPPAAAPATPAAATATRQQLQPPALFSPPGALPHRPDTSATMVTPAAPAAQPAQGFTGLLKTLACIVDF